MMNLYEIQFRNWPIRQVVAKSIENALSVFKDHFEKEKTLKDDKIDHGDYVSVTLVSKDIIL